MANLNTSVYHKSISHKGFSGKHKRINYGKGNMAVNLIRAQCPNCGASLNIEEDCKEVCCEYCGSKVLLHNENEASVKQKGQSGYLFCPRQKICRCIKNKSSEDQTISDFCDCRRDDDFNRFCRRTCFGRFQFMAVHTCDNGYFFSLCRRIFMDIHIKR